MVRNAEISVISKQAEEARILANTFRHLQDCLGPERNALYRDALMQAGLSSDDILNGENLSMQKLDLVLRSIRTKVPGITLLMFSTMSLLDLGMVGYAGASSGTVGKAIEILIRYHELTSDRFDDVLSVEGDAAVLRPVPHITHMHEYQDVVEDSLAGNWSLIRQLMGSEMELSQVQVNFSYPAPNYAEVYDQAFSCPHFFDQEQSGIRFPVAWLDYPVATANWAMSDICTTMCERILGPGEQDAGTPHAVRQLLLSRPGRRMLRLEEAAEALRLSTAQLRKRLYRAETSYKQIVLEVRMALARHYLEATRLSVQEIAYLLDYSQPGPFSRAFKSYFGIPPIECRTQSGQVSKLH